MDIATARANSNIAFIKYWGNRDADLNLPANGSISMNLACLQTTTQVHFDPDLKEDQLWIDDKQITGDPLERVQRFLDAVRIQAGQNLCAKVRSRNNFPANAGLVSSASAFAALALAASRAIGLELSERELSVLARLGSGSAARSISGGFVEWYPASTHAESYAETIASPDYWELVDVIAIVEEAAKSTTSSEGHRLADSSPLQNTRVQTASERLDLCRSALLERDFQKLASVVEQDSNLMHAAMITSNPPLFYWQPATLKILKAVPFWRSEGLEVCYTIDAGANVHLICTRQSKAEIENLLKTFPEVRRMIVSEPGHGAYLVHNP